MYMHVLSTSLRRPFQTILDTGFNKGTGFGRINLYHKDAMKHIFQKVFQVLGRFYEVNRIDRDNYIQIYWENINPSEHLPASVFIPRQHELIHILHVYTTCMYICSYV